MAATAKPTLLVLINDVFAPEPDTKHSDDALRYILAALNAACTHIRILVYELSTRFDLAYLVDGTVLVAAPGADEDSAALEAAVRAAVAIGRANAAWFVGAGALVARPPDAPPPRLTLALTATRASIIATVDGQSVTRDLGGTLADLGGRDSAASVKLARAAVPAIALYAGEASPSP